VAKACLVLLHVILASALAGAQALGPISGGSGPDLKTPYVGSSLTCTQPHTVVLVVPRPVLERAKLKARLATLLRESPGDDAQGIVNMAREKEIKKLANRLRSDRQDS
jgi:hypothetical protein